MDTDACFRLLNSIGESRIPLRPSILADQPIHLVTLSGASSNVLAQSKDPFHLNYQRLLEEFSPETIP